MNIKGHSSTSSSLARFSQFGLLSVFLTKLQAKANFFGFFVLAMILFFEAFGMELERAKGDYFQNFYSFRCIFLGLNKSVFAWFYHLFYSFCNTKTVSNCDFVLREGVRQVIAPLCLNGGKGVVRSPFLIFMHSVLLNVKENSFEIFNGEELRNIVKNLKFFDFFYTVGEINHSILVVKPMSHLFSVIFNDFNSYFMQLWNTEVVMVSKESPLLDVLMGGRIGSFFVSFYDVVYKKSNKYLALELLTESNLSIFLLGLLLLNPSFVKQSVECFVSVGFLKNIFLFNRFLFV